MRYLSAISMQANVPEQYIEQARLEARKKIAGNKKELIAERNHLIISYRELQGIFLWGFESSSVKY